MDYQSRAEEAERHLRALLEVHELGQRAGAQDYDAVRKVRRLGERAWTNAKAYVDLIDRAQAVAEVQEAVKRGPGRPRKDANAAA